ncbi:MAG: hypothetical protein ACR2RF_05345 [Geminicoccaceae bacterium]
MTRQASDLFGATPQALPESTKNQLQALAMVGAPKDLIVAMVDFAGIKLCADHRRFLTGPVVQHRNGWQDTTPPWLYDAIPAERLAIVLDDHAHGREGSKVGPAELAAVLYPASMEAPMHHWSAEIYLWACGHAQAAKKGVPADEIRKVVDFVQDGEVIDPAGSLHHDYRHVANDIRRRVIRHQKERERQTRRQERQSPKNQPSPDVIDDQLDLF